MAYYSTLDITKNQYTEEQLIDQYRFLDNWAIIRKQKNLSADFCIRWILDVEERGIRISYEETFIVDADVLKYQKHLTQEDLREARRRLAPEFEEEKKKAEEERKSRGIGNE